MTRVGVACRLAVMAAAFLALWPVLIAARRVGSRAAGRMPVRFHRLFLRLFGVRVSVSGRPPEAGLPTLVLANHVSWLDIPVFGASAPLSFVAKREIAGWPVLGFLARLQGSIFLDRERKAGTAEANVAVAARLRRGDTVLLFPEGTTGDGIRLLPFRSSLVGAARAALAGAGLDSIALQPLAIAYRRRNGLPLSRREMPAVAWYGDMELGPHLADFVRGGPYDVVVSWGEPVRFDVASDRKRATAALERAVRDLVRACEARPHAAGREAGPVLMTRMAL